MQYLGISEVDWSALMVFLSPPKWGCSQSHPDRPFVINKPLPSDLIKAQLRPSKLQLQLEPTLLTIPSRPKWKLSFYGMRENIADYFMLFTPKKKKKSPAILKTLRFIPPVADMRELSPAGTKINLRASPLFVASWVGIRAI